MTPRWPDSAVLDAFHGAGLYLPSEREEYDARIEVETKEADERKVTRERRETVGTLAVVALSILTATVGISYSYGRAAEAELTLDAYRAAEAATGLLRGYVEQGERALEVCRAANVELEAFLGAR